MNEPGTKLRTARNVAIVLLLALGLTLLPNGGNLATAILTALLLIMLAASGLLLARFWNQTQFTRDAMTDRQRGLIYGSLGAIALMVAGADELFETGLGTVAWIAIMVASVWLILQTVRDAQAI